MNKHTKLTGLFLYSSFLIVAAYILIYPYIAKPHYGIDGFVDLTNQSFSSSDSYSIGRFFKLNKSFCTQSYKCYTLNILVPAGTDKISLYIPYSYSTSCLYVNDRPVYINKLLGKTYFTGPATVTIPIKSRLVQMRLYIDNASAASPSFFSSNYYSRLFTIGGSNAILKQYNLNFVFMLTLTIISLISFLFHFAIFLYKKNIHVHFLLSLVCLSLFATLLFDNQGIICLLFNNLNNSLVLRILTISYLFRNFIFNLYIQLLCTKKYNKIVSVCFYSLCVFLFVAAIIVPFSHLYNLLFAILLFTYITSLFCIIMFIFGSTIDNNPKAKRGAIIGLFAILLGNYWDIYQYLVPGSLASLSSFFYILYSFIQAMILSSVYNRTNADILKLTPLLNKAMDELQNDKSTYINTHIKPAFLYETMDSIDNYADKNLDKVDSLIQNLSKYLRQSLDFSINPENYSLRKEINNSKAFAALVREQLTNIRINFDIQKDLPDTFVPQSSILTLIQNALDYGFQGILQPQINISAYKIDESFIEVKIADNGVGMTKAEISFAMSQPGSDFGVGLFYINQKLLARGSNGLQIESNAKTGTTISFILKIEDTSEVFPYDI